MKTEATGVQHTQGPWRTGDRFQTIFGPSDEQPCPPVIATIHGASGNKRVNISNAKLISAAPDLLAACEAAEANLSPKYSSEHHVMKLLRAAILKAGGKLRCDDEESGQDRESYSDTQDRKTYAA